MKILSNDKFSLVLSSFLMLFVELVIIRWSGSNLYYLFAFTNIILIASFLGMGIGFLRPVGSRNLFYLSPILLTFIIAISYYFNIDPAIRLNPVTDNIDYSSNYFHENYFPVALTLPVIFLATVALMMSLADGVKSFFQRFIPLQAYRFEILGSLTGLIMFSLLSFLEIQPFVWGIVICICYLLLAKKQKTQGLMEKIYQGFIIFLQIFSLSIMMIILVTESNLPNHFWSSYYKIVLHPYAGDRYAVKVNGLVQQIIESVSQRQRVKPFYMIPYEYRVKSELNNVLVIGAGTGGDVAIALSQGAKHVDAVEIDPMLYALGKKFNPDQPYQDKRVNIIINDGRAFLTQTEKKYDMIIYALTDSLMLIMGQSSLRLENYLYTQEGINQAAKHLTPEGIFTIYNYIQPDWLVNRFAKTMQASFHSPPCIKTYSSTDYYATVLIASNNTANLHCESWFKADTNPEVKPASDDYPFIYLENDHFPPVYIVSLSFLLFATFLIIRLFGISFGNIPKHLDLFLMGSAFLLLESKNVINFALLFGTTWLVNALVFIGIIFTVYLAIELSRFIHDRRPVILFLHLLLPVSLLLAFCIPDSYLLGLSILPRFLMATALAFSPVFIANLIFADRFRQAQQSTIAFGVNLIGAVVGGMLEYSSLITGYGNLLLLIAGIYVVAICFRSKPAMH